MTFSPDLWESLWLTIRLAAVSTLILLLIGLPIARWLARGRRGVRLVIEALLTMPVVLPSAVIGFYLLVIYGRVMGRQWVFSFPGLVAGSVIYSLPFAIQPFRAGFAKVSRDLLEAARLSGASGFQTFWNVTLPLAWTGIVTGLILSFAHTLGEFGLVLMLGGGAPGAAKVASTLLYDEAGKMDFAAAHASAATLLVIAFLVIAAVLAINRLPEETPGPERG